MSELSYSEFVLMKQQFTKAILDNRRDVQHCIEGQTLQTDLLRKVLVKMEEQAKTIEILQDEIEGMKTEKRNRNG